jgi:hypothetical protein
MNSAAHDSDGLPDLDTLDLTALLAAAGPARHTPDERDALTARHNALAADFNALAVCPPCSGRGHLPEYSHVAGGVCFACSGTGRHVMNRRVAKIAAKIEADLAAIRAELNG